jgi:hypothetical protein
MLVIVACGGPSPIATADRASLLDQFRAGGVELTCQLPCAGTWVNNLPLLRTLDETGQWKQLAVEVTRINYQKDVDYYYLGRAAEGLGLAAAARGYYARSYALATGPVDGPRCRPIDGSCNGVDLLAVLPGKLQAAQIVAARQPATGRGRLARPSSDPVAFCRAAGDFDNDTGVTALRRLGFTGSDVLDDPLPDGSVQHSKWRCMDGKLLACGFGANERHCAQNAYGLNPSPAIRRYCTRFPNEFVPGAANDTSLFWECHNGQPALSQPATLDRRGFNRAEWN